MTRIPRYSLQNVLKPDSVRSRNASEFSNSVGMRRNLKMFFLFMAVMSYVFTELLFSFILMIHEGSHREVYQELGIPTQL